MEHSGELTTYVWMTRREAWCETTLWSCCGAKPEETCLKFICDVCHPGEIEQGSRTTKTQAKKASAPIAIWTCCEQEAIAPDSAPRNYSIRRLNGCEPSKRVKAEMHVSDGVEALTPDSDRTVTYDAAPTRPERDESKPVPRPRQAVGGGAEEWPERLPGVHGGSDVTPLRPAVVPPRATAMYGSGGYDLPPRHQSSLHSSMDALTTASTNDYDPYSSRSSSMRQSQYAESVSSYASNPDTVAAERAAAERRRTYYCMIRKRIEQLADELEIMYPKDPEYSHLGPAIKSMASILPSR